MLWIEQNLEHQLPRLDDLFVGLTSHQILDGALYDDCSWRSSS